MFEGDPSSLQVENAFDVLESMEQSIQEQIEAVLDKDKSAIQCQCPSPRRTQQAVAGVAALVSKVKQKRKKRQSKKGKMQGDVTSSLVTVGKHGSESLGSQ